MKIEGWKYEDLLMTLYMRLKEFGEEDLTDILKTLSLFTKNPEKQDLDLAMFVSALFTLKSFGLEVETNSEILTNLKPEINALLKAYEKFSKAYFGKIEEDASVMIQNSGTKFEA